jgi:hypothetical protein
MGCVMTISRLAVSYVRVYEVQLQLFLYEHLSYGFASFHIIELRQL